MKNLITILLILVIHFSAVASHLYGGYITTKKISGRKYEVRVIVTSDPAGAASQNLTSINLSYGDGSSENVLRLTQQNLEDNFRTNIYVTTHEYQTDGLFIINYEDPNLIDMIANVNHGESSNAVLRLTATIHISSTFNSTEEPHPLAYTFPIAVYGDQLKYNPTFIDLDGDDIVYELLNPSSADLPNYSLPQGISINRYSGMITWDNVANTGYYLIQYKVSAYKNNVFLSSTTVTQMLKVADLVISFPASVSFPNTDMAPAGWYRAVVNTPGQQVHQPFIVPVMNNTTSNTIEVYSELLLVNGRLDNRQNDSQQVVEFSWEALSGMMRPTPYFVTFRLQSKTFARVSKDYNIAFYHGAPLNTATNELIAIQDQISVYPNPSANGNCFFLLPSSMSGHATLHIYDLVGKEILSTPLMHSSYNWNHTLQKPGLYLYEARLEDGKVLKGKVLLE